MSTSSGYAQFEIFENLFFEGLLYPHQLQIKKKFEKKSQKAKKVFENRKNRNFAFFVSRPSATPLFSKSEFHRSLSLSCVLSENIH